MYIVFIGMGSSGYGELFKRFFYGDKFEKQWFRAFASAHVRNTFFF